jgi:bifunctional DNA-binding transcriptional regulator/antitoxin component of YhaV-PrlF toxin-antitoxin module
MAFTAKITSKGQVTIPRRVSDVLESNTVEFIISDDTVIVRPVKSVGGALAKYAAKHVPLKEVRKKVWKEVADEKAGK